MGEIVALDADVFSVASCSCVTIALEVTIHGRAARLPYAWRWLRERNVQFAPNSLDLGAADHAMDEATAGRADAAKVAPGFGHGNIFGHVAGRLFGRATRQAVDFSWLEAPPSCAPSRLKKGGERQTFEDDGTPAVDRLEALLLPVADCVAVATE